MKNLAKSLLAIEDSKKRIVCGRFLLKILAKEHNVRMAYKNMLKNYINSSERQKSVIFRLSYLKGIIFANN